MNINKTKKKGVVYPESDKAIILSKYDKVDANRLFDVVFVTNTNRIERPYYDPSVRYRAFNPVNFLRRKGIKSIVVTQNVFEENYESFTTAETIVFHRPRFSEVLARYVIKYKKRQTLVCDYDDLIFDVKAAADTPAVSDRNEDFTIISRNLAANAEIAAMFDYKSVSTQRLAEAANRCIGGESLVIHNGLTRTYVDMARTIRKNRAGLDNLYSIGYFAGTASHNEDFISIVPAIANFLELSAKNTLFVAGPVFIPSTLDLFRNQIITTKVVTFYEMASLISLCRMVIGPLIINEFNVCKSGLKFFEAGALGVQVAATPIPDVDRFISPLLHKCTDVEQWANAFLDNTALDFNILEQAAEAVCSEAALDKQMSIWIDAFLGRN